jgi:hypothetical protein
MRSTITSTPRHVAMAMLHRNTSSLRLFALARSHELAVIAERCAPRAPRPDVPHVSARFRLRPVGDKQ